MTPHKQLIRHDPENGAYGDCHRTAVACLLDLHPSEVPHVYRDPTRSNEECDAEMAEFLAARGLRMIAVAWSGATALDDVLGTMEALNPGALFILGGTSRLGTGHSVIAGLGRVVHDPSPLDSGIVGPMEDGHWWIHFLALNTAMREAA